MSIRGYSVCSTSYLYVSQCSRGESESGQAHFLRILFRPYAIVKWKEVLKFLDGSPRNQSMCFVTRKRVRLDALFARTGSESYPNQAETGAARQLRHYLSAYLNS